MIKKELHEKYVRKVNSSTQKTKISKTENTELPTGFNLSAIIDESIEKTKKIKLFKMRSSQELVDLTYLHKKKNNFKVASLDSKKIKNR